MKTKLSLVVLALLTAFSHSPITTAQTTTNRDWAAVVAQPQGTKLLIKLKTGKTIEGRVTGVSDTALQLTKGNSRIDLDRGDIKKVWRVGGRQTGKSTLMGLGIGAGAGAAIGAVVAASDGPAESGEGHLPIAHLGAAGAIIGTVSGVITGLFVRKKVLIYEAN